MKITIQVNEGKAWDETLPVLHDVASVDMVANIAFAISKQFGRATVRITYPTDIGIHENRGNLLAYVSRLNGSYVQST